MLFVNLTTKQADQLKVELEQALQTKQFIKLKIVEMSSQRTQVKEIARFFNISEARVRRVIHRFNENSFDGLLPKPIPGRPLKIKWTKEEWEDFLYQKPCDFEQLNSGAQNWSQELVILYFQTYHDLPISQGSISKSLKSVGLRWRRAKLRVQSPDPLYQVKRDRVEALRQRAKDRSLTLSDLDRPPPDGEKSCELIYFDATDLHWCPDIGPAYGPAGDQVKVNSPGLENPWYSLFGSMFYPSGEGFYTIHSRKRSVEVIEHFRLLIEAFPTKFFFIVMDNASAHHTAKMRQFADEMSDHIEFVFLPTYSPHLNLIERLWRILRAQVTRNRFFDSLDDLAKAVVIWLEKLSFAQFCSIMGIPDFEL